MQNTMIPVQGLTNYPSNKTGAHREGARPRWYSLGFHDVTALFRGAGFVLHLAQPTTVQ